MLAFMHACIHTYVIQAKHNANSELLLDKHRLHCGIFIRVTSNDRSHGSTHTFRISGLQEPSWYSSVCSHELLVNDLSCHRYCAHVF